MTCWEASFMRRFSLAISLAPAFAFVLLALAIKIDPKFVTPAFATLCTSAISGPNDPDYAPAERNLAGGMTFNAEQWHLYDCIPQSAPLAFDSEGASGMSLNRAWAVYGLGRKDVTVAYIEGGVNWRLRQSFDFAPKAYLKCGGARASADAKG